MLSTPRRVLAALTAVAALSATAACSSSGSVGNPTHKATTSPAAAQFPVTVRSAGGTFTSTHRPKAFVSLSPTATEMLYAIGAGGQVKAVDKNSDYPATAPRTKLDSLQLNTEAVAAYQPDLVVAAGLTAAQTKQLQTLHIPVLDEPAAVDLNQSYQEFTQLGQVTGHRDGAAKTVATMKREIAAIVRATPKQHATYYYELDQTYYSVTSATFIGRTLHLLGLTSIADAAKGAAAAGGYPQLSAEFILKANPTYVFLADTRCCKQSVTTVGRRAGWSTLGAVRAGRVVPLDDDIASRWGPRIVDLLRTVSQAM